jgi:hypothetical protein
LKFILSTDAKLEMFVLFKHQSFQLKAVLVCKFMDLFDQHTFLRVR